jgi:hypothetical protein
MKNMKNILVAALAAAAIGSANAETIYVTGSTAFRGAANTALKAMSGMTLLAADNTSLTSAGNLLFTNSGGFLVNVHWSGSEAGIQSILNTNAVFGYLPEDGSAGTNGTTTATSAGATNSHYAQISFSDTYQATSVFNGKKAGDGFNYPAASADTQVGVVAFTYIASKGFPSNGVSMTATAAQNLFANGFCSAALLTGSSANQQDVCYLLGRNKDSGTRLSTLIVTGTGVASTVHQFAVATNSYITNSGSAAGTAVLQGASGNTNTLISYPVETINGISSAVAGNSGYSSGGTLCGFMTNTYAPQGTFVVDGATTTPLGGSYTGNTYLIGYAGQSDANSKVSSGLIELPYEGVLASTNAIAQGQYPFWSYEHCLKGPNSTAHTATFYTALCAQVVGTPTSTLSPNVSLGDMQVARLTDGGVITQNY